jgi:hypothetical protein
MTNVDFDQLGRLHVQIAQALERAEDRLAEHAAAKLDDPNAHPDEAVSLSETQGEVVAARRLIWRSMGIISELATAA